MERASFSHRTIFTALGISLALGFAIGVYVLLRFATYVPVAMERVPEDAEFVARLNLQQSVLYDPFVEYLLPVVERGKKGPEPRVKHLERKTTLELNVDARELVLAELPGRRWLIVVAGFLRHDEVLAGISRLCKDEGIVVRQVGQTLVHESGVTLGIATDGTLLLGSDHEAVTSAQGRSERPSWAPEVEGIGVAVATRLAPGRTRAPGEAPSHLAGGTVVVKAETYFPVEAHFRLDGENWTKEQLGALLSAKKGDFSYVFPIDGLVVESLGDGEATAKTQLGRARFDEAVARVATRLDRLFPPVEPRLPGEKPAK